MTFLPADCKDRFVTTEHLLKVGKRGEEREVKIEIRLPALLPSSINVDISEFYIMSECGFENVPLTLWFWSRAVENRFQCVSCFFGCLAFPDQTWIDHDILYKCQACACAHVHTQIQKWIKVSKIKKKSNWLFHLDCLEFFHLVFIPWAKLCILFCNQLAFNLFGTLSPFLSVHRWVIAAALHPAKRGVSQLRGHYLDSYWTAIFTCGPGGRTCPQAHKIRHSTKPCHDMPALRWCCKPQKITDEQIRDIKHAMGQVGVSLRHGKMKTEVNGIESEHYLCFLSWKRCFYLMLCLKLHGILNFSWRPNMSR